jgi:hypothetical protein
MNQYKSDMATNRQCGVREPRFMDDNRPEAERLAIGLPTVSVFRFASRPPNRGLTKVAITHYDTT